MLEKYATIIGFVFCVLLVLVAGVNLNRSLFREAVRVKSFLVMTICIATIVIVSCCCILGIIAISDFFRISLLLR